MEDLKVEKLQFGADYIYEEHRHNDYEINYVEDGRCVMNLEGEKVVLHEGECIVIPPMVLHSFGVDYKKGCTIRQLIWTTEFGTFEEEVKDLPVFTKKQYSKIPGCYEISENMKNLLRYAHRRKDYGYEMLYRLEVKKLCLLLSVEIHRMDEHNSKYENKIFSRILMEMNEGFDQEINLQELAEKYRISSRYLRRLFHQQLGCSAMEYLTILRMEKAKKLLAESDLSISRIAMDVGYNSVPYFDKIFKKKTGITPGEFKKRT